MLEVGKEVLVKGRPDKIWYIHHRMGADLFMVYEKDPVNKPEFIVAKPEWLKQF